MTSEECGVCGEKFDTGFGLNRHQVMFHESEWLKKPARFRTDTRGYEYWESSFNYEDNSVFVHQLLAIFDGFDPHDVFGGDMVVHHGNTNNSRIPQLETPWANWSGNLEVMDVESHSEYHGVIPREELLEELRRLSSDGSAPRAKDMSERGEYSHSTYENRFGTWNEALEEAGFNLNREYGIAEEDLLEEIKRLAEELGRPPTRNEIDEEGVYRSASYDNKFETWTSAVEEAGFDPEVNARANRFSDEELIEEIRRLKTELGSEPRVVDMRNEGRYSSGVYSNRFGSWSNAKDLALGDGNDECEKHGDAL